MCIDNINQEAFDDLKFQENLPSHLIRLKGLIENFLKIPHQQYLIQDWNC